MYTTKYLLSTTKEKPKKTESISHQLMLRSGMIRMLSSGIYTWLPTGWKIIKKVTKIISDILDQHGYLEICIPTMQPKKIWDQSGRTELYGQELIHITNRRKKKYILSPTNEEAINYIFSKEIHSHKQLPIVFYQIQKKFRDEIRPRFGIIRSIEFLMKDAYSFHINKKSLKKTYTEMKKIYIKIFKKLKLNFKIIQADSKIMGGSISHEFHALSNSGEDKIIFSKKSNYAVHVKKFNKKENKTKIYLLKTRSNQSKYKKAVLIMRKNDHLNKEDLKTIDIIEYPVIFIPFSKKFLTNQLDGYQKLFSNKKIFTIADSKIVDMSYFIFKTNKKFTPILWRKKNIFNKIITIKNINKIFYYKTTEETLKKKNSTEIGHIFQIGKKYSKYRNFLIQDINNHLKLLHMGCYGIGINRIVSSIIEQNHDNHGIIWPNNVAPFQIFIIPINMHKSVEIKKIAQSIYIELINEKIDVLLDDRKESIGKMFTDMNLIGIPYGIIINKKSIQSKKIEFYSRKKTSKINISISQIILFIKKKLFN